MFSRSLYKALVTHFARRVALVVTPGSAFALFRAKMTILYNATTEPRLILSVACRAVRRATLTAVLIATDTTMNKLTSAHAALTARMDVPVPITNAQTTRQLRQ